MKRVSKMIWRSFRVIRWAVLLGAAFFFVWILYMPSGTKFVIDQIVERTLGVKKASWESMEGTLAKGIRVTHLEIQALPYLSQGSFIRIQELKVGLSRFGIKGVNVKVKNGRLFFKGEEPIVFEAQLHEGEVEANVYTQRLNLLDLRQVLTQFFDVVLFKGDVRDVDLLITGPLDKPNVRGKFFVEKLFLPEFMLQDVAVRPQLKLRRVGSHWERFGVLFLDSGRFENQWVKVHIQPSRLIFSGQISVYPEFDVKATTRIAQTDIYIHAQGSQKKHQLFLSSDPVYSKEQILLMLTTGKRWTGIDRIGKDDRHQELTSNFVDYLLFGGSRSKLIRRLGLSDISILADEKKQGLRVSKELTHRLDIGYGVEVEQGDSQQRAVTQRLDSQYRLTNKVTIGVQKEFKSDMEKNNSTLIKNDDMRSPSYISGHQDIPDDRVYLKYRTAF